MKTQQEIVDYMNSKIDKLIPALQNLVKTGEEVPPVVFLLFESEGIDMVLRPMPQSHIFFANNEMKDRLPAFIRSIRDALREPDVDPELRNEELIGVMLVSDIFRANDTDIDPSKSVEDYVPPSERPDRIEAIMFSCHINGHSFMRVYPYIRGEQIIFSDVEIIDNAGNEGRFAKLFPD